MIAVYQNLVYSDFLYRVSAEEEGPICRSAVELYLDLGGVGFMDSSGIAVVLRTWKRLREYGGAMRLVHVPPQPAKVLKAAGVDRLVPWETEPEG